MVIVETPHIRRCWRTSGIGNGRKPKRPRGKNGRILETNRYKIQSMLLHLAMLITLFSPSASDTIISVGAQHNYYCGNVLTISSNIMSAQQQSLSQWVTQLNDTLFIQPNDEIALKAVHDQVDPSLVVRYTAHVPYILISISNQGIPPESTTTSTITTNSKQAFNTPVVRVHRSNTTFL